MCGGADVRNSATIAASFGLYLAWRSSESRGIIGPYEALLTYRTKIYQVIWGLKDHGERYLQSFLFVLPSCPLIEPVSVTSHGSIISHFWGSRNRRCRPSLCSRAQGDPPRHEGCSSGSAKHLEASDQLDGAIGNIG